MVVFLSGIGGVFLGMACLYISIKIVSGILVRWGPKEKEK